MCEFGATLLTLLLGDPVVTSAAAPHRKKKYFWDFYIMHEQLAFDNPAWDLLGKVNISMRSKQCYVEGATVGGWWWWGVSLHLQDTTAEKHESIFVLPSFVSQKEVWSLWGADLWFCERTEWFSFPLFLGLSKKKKSLDKWESVETDLTFFFFLLAQPWCSFYTL